MRGRRAYDSEALLIPEQQETRFEQARQKLADFLATPYQTYIENSQAQGKFSDFSINEARFDDWTEEADLYHQVGETLQGIRNELRQHLQEIVAEARQARKLPEAIDHIKNLLLEDHLDEQSMPAIFKVGKPFPGTDIVAVYEEYLHTETDNEQTFRSYYYEDIVETLGTCGSEAQPTIVECLADIDTIRFLNKQIYKLGKNISPEEFNAKYEAWVSENNVYESDEGGHWGEGIMLDDLNRGGLTSYFLMEDKHYKDTAFGKAVLSGLVALSASNAGVHDKVRAYALNKILTTPEASADLYPPINNLLNQAPAAAGKELMEKIQTTEDRLTKVLATRLLYRLELGKIGMSERGVNYLGKTFDLGEYNRPEYSAHRATGDGQVAVFDNQQHAIGFFQLRDLDSPEIVLQARLLDFTHATLFHTNPNETEAERTEREQILQEFKANYFKTYLTDFGQETGVMFNNLSFREQGWFLWYMQHAPSEDRARAITFIKTYHEPGFRLFVALETDKAAGSKLLDLADRLTPQEMTGLIEDYQRVAGRVELIAAEVSADFEPEDLHNEVLIQGLLVRAKDLLATTHRRITDGETPAVVLHDIHTEFRAESSRQSALSGLFRNTAELVGAHEAGSIDLARYAREQDILASEMKKQDGLGLFLRALGSRGVLRPIPEIHWRVDRNSEEYKRRLGVDVMGLLKALGEPGKKKLLLEFGPGSGKSRAERAQAGLGNQYTDIIMADSIYYPVNTLIEKLFDWEKLEAASGGTLSAEERSVLSDAIYKILMIADGQTAEDKFEYSAERLQQLTRDPNALKELLPQAAARLKNISLVPDTISSRDSAGHVIYPYKINLTVAGGRSAAFEAAKQTLAHTPARFLRQDIAERDLYHEIPAFPAGVVVSDFSNINQLRDSSIDVAMGVRSTVYKRDTEYESFMATMADKLSSSGIYIDDNVRDNDGWRSRMAELARVAKTLRERRGPVGSEVRLQLALGPGLPSEDADKGVVPLAIVMSRGEASAGIVSQFVEPGYRLISFDNYLAELRQAGSERLRQLDPTGQLLKTVEEPEPSEATTAAP